MSKLVVIDGGYFYASIIVNDGVVSEAAPILRWMVGWGRRDVWETAKRRGWTVAAVYPDPASS